MEHGQVDNIKSQILEALEEYNGIVSSACASIGLARSTYYLWLKEDAEFAKQVDDITDVAIDFVESKLFEKIKGVQVMGKEDVYDLPPSDTAIIFYLKTKGKKRGYVEKSEVTNHNINYSIEPTAEEAKAIKEAFDKDI